MGLAKSKDINEKALLGGGAQICDSVQRCLDFGEELDGNVLSQDVMGEVLRIKAGIVAIAHSKHLR